MDVEEEELEEEEDPGVDHWEAFRMLWEEREGLPVEAPGTVQGEEGEIFDGPSIEGGPTVYAKEHLNADSTPYDYFFIILPIVFWMTVLSNSRQYAAARGAGTTDVHPEYKVFELKDIPTPSQHSQLSGLRYRKGYGVL